MTSTIRNLIIFIGIGAILVMIYIFFIKPGPETPDLTSSGDATTLPDASTTTSPDTTIQKILPLLINVKNIKLDLSIFNDRAFTTLHDSSIVLVPDGNEGRPNPFAPIGTDIFIVPPTISTTEASPTTGSPTP